MAMKRKSDLMAKYWVGHNGQQDNNLIEAMELNGFIGDWLEALAEEGDWVWMADAYGRLWYSGNNRIPPREYLEPIIERERYMAEMGRVGTGRLAEITKKAWAEATEDYRKYSVSFEQATEWNASKKV